MKIASFLFLAALACGCKKSDSCTAAIDHSMELSKGDMSKRPGMDDKTLAKLHDLGIQHCRDDKWPDEATSCMIDAKTEKDAQACYGKLSADQQQKMNDAMMAAVKGAAPADVTPSQAPKSSP